MFGFFKKRMDFNSIVPRIQSISAGLSKDIENEFNNSNKKIEVEYLIYCYTVSDYWLSQKEVNNQKRRELFVMVDKEVQKYVNDSEIAKKVFDNRINNYYMILSKSNQKFDQEYFKSCVEYQIQLLACILKENKFSFYNPVPKSPKDYSPIILDLFMTSVLNKILIENMDSIVGLAKELQDINIA